MSISEVNKVLVSIVMPSYNSGAFIEESIASVIKQTVSNWELLIVDDCSTDNTFEIISPYLSKYCNIKYFRLEKNSGTAVARSNAIMKAAGKYIAFLDSDDVWMPEKLEKQISFMKRTNSLFCCTAYAQMDEYGKSKNLVCIPPKMTDYKKMLRLSDPIGNLTVMYDQSALGKYQVPNIRKRNDFALWLHILRDVPYCAGMSEVLATYRVRMDSVSSNKLAQAKYHWQLYREIEKLSIIDSCWAMICWAWVKGTGIGLTRITKKQNHVRCKRKS